jgi:predicted kinase
MKKVRKSIVYQRCEDLTGILVEQGYSVVNDYDLEYLLKRYVGADPRTVKAYKNHLVEFNFLERTKEGFNILKNWIPVQKRLEAVTEYSK